MDNGLKNDLENPSKIEIEGIMKSNRNGKVEKTDGINIKLIKYDLIT